MAKIDMKKALLNPGSVFPSPEDLLEEPALSKEQKIDLLKRWKYDTKEVLDASSEGMPPSTETDLLRRIGLALESLEKDG